jgi:beta-lactam-binding protein with PASTA domain
MKAKLNKEFDTVNVFRAIKNQISKDISGMTYEQLREWLNKNKFREGNRSED